MTTRAEWAEIARKKAQEWLIPDVDPESRNEIERMLANDPGALTEAFYSDLEFGTGGLRGVMGVGTMRMNRYTVGMATQGLANYILKQAGLQESAVVIAHDSRLQSPEFARTAAEVLAANGIRVFLFAEMRPTPLLSFAVRNLKCRAGIVITASHNPKEYNGYKVYWEDGAQVLTPHDEGIIREVRAVKGIRDVKFGGGNKLIETPGPEVEEEYLKKLDGLIHDRSAILANRELPIVYTSIHGTGITLVPRALKTAGFTQIHVVPEQSVPDGRFPTVTSPNPEEREALAMGLQLCEQVRAELLLGNDPDADRVGIAVRNGQQEMVLLNGNQAGSLLVWYELYQWQKLGRLNGRQYIASTVVTSELFPSIAGYFGVPCYKTLTGFKYIAGVMREREGLETFIAGGEESYGYLAGDFVRDKDAVISSVKFAEIAAWCTSQGRSMWDLLMEIYTTCGLYHDELVSITMKGIDGLENIRSLMEKLRSSPPDALAGSRIVRIADLKRGTVRDARTGEEKPLGLPLSNVLQFELEDGSRISARPSGTEPKIKFYFSFRDEFLGLQHYATQISVMHDRVTRARKELGVEAG